jgi:hypothetical protein
MNNQSSELSSLDQAYIAGLFDAEGYVRLREVQQKHQVSYLPQFNVHITYPIVLEWLQNMFGGTIRTNKKEPDRKQDYVWELHIREMPGFFSAVSPYLRLKKPEVELMQEYFTTIVAGRPGHKRSDAEQKMQEQIYHDLTQLGRMTTIPMSPFDGTTEDIAYVSGLFDGDGCIWIERSNNRYSLRAHIGISCQNILECIQGMFGGTIVDLKPSSNLPHYKQKWMWRIGSTDLHMFLPTILPYLRERAPQADLAIEYCKEFGTGHRERPKTYAEVQRQEWYYQEMKRLKTIEYPPTKPLDKSTKREGHDSISEIVMSMPSPLETDITRDNISVEKRQDG